MNLGPLAESKEKWFSFGSLAKTKTENSIITECKTEDALSEIAAFPLSSFPFLLIL